ncbi:MAG: cupin domain-containing protein [Zavarzinella sp.]|nr:cupin domain-containing protein [Zavarzinella sp.]
MTADEVIALLQLQPHPVEGGFFRETYRSAATLQRDGATRSVGTAIYYLLTPKTVSALHRLPGDEVFHFYAGDPVRMLQLWPDGSTRTLTLGSDLKAGQVPQLVVPGGVWQGSVLADGGSWALLGATMAPGFDYADYTAGDRAELTRRYPGVATLIERLTPGG